MPQHTSPSRPSEPSGPSKASGPSRRTTVRALAALAGGTALTAATTSCAVGGPTGPDRLSDGPVTLRMTWWGGDARHQATHKAIALFEKKYPRIRVEAEFADWNGYWDRLATSAAGGNAPDVIQNDIAYLASYAERGGLFDLGRSEHFDASLFTEETLDTGRHDGGLYGVPASVTSMAMLVNRTLVDELGLRLPDTRSWTWDDLEKFGREVARASGGKVHGAIPLGGPGIPILWARQHRQELFGRDGSVAVDPDVLGGLWEMTRDWSDNGAAPGAGVIVDSQVLPLDQSPIVTGKVAISPAWCNQLIAYKAAAGGDELELVDMPTLPGSPRRHQFVKPGMYWSVSSQTQHPAEAALLVNFLVGDEQCTKILGAERGIPAAARTRENIAPSLAPDDTAALRYVERIEKNLAGAPLPLFPNGASAVEDILQRYVEEVVFGRSSGPEAGAGFADELSGLIESAS
ncbi:ABC transporter substrate-binding protein [Streptomyces jeddahensis]|uniref:Putative ABC transporter substrate-binding protein YesO n=1 Tax=Streptomyces jeddahensis TaxID=1716141 RepID=A0A177HU27_9ACTN|nr:extracellular solute-binding protein [Streptomyces jeddahensis]OAH14027.1 putative ABC transporter substrate-binding protein YesO [Streptomyces jeddahensis]